MTSSVGFHSILFDRPADSLEEAEEPPYFGDLNLDQIVASVTAGREGYRLEPILHSPSRDAATVRYRQDVSRDLESSDVFESVGEFAERMRAMRDLIEFVERSRYPHHKEGWFLEAVETYLGAVRGLTEKLSRLEVASSGFRALRAYLDAYVASDGFTSLEAELHEVRAALTEVRYGVHIKGDRVTVSRYDAETDYSVEVQSAFAKFKERAGKDYRVKLPGGRDMNHVEGRVLELVARLHPEAFRTLTTYYQRHRDYLDDTIARFDREVQFYLAYLEHIARIRSADLPFCYPVITEGSEDVSAHGAFDLALAGRAGPEGPAVVCNDFCLSDPERILVVTGPNQGGKTTFARMIGQLHYLASLGYPVPGHDAQLFLPDRAFTHFEREEDVTTLRGKLEDELVRIRDILGEATSSSVVIMNESFTSTTLMDALVLGKEVLAEITQVGSLCVYVTFVDELASLGPATVSMVSLVDPHDPTVRTFRVVRRPADGLAYAAAIAEKYGLTYDSLRGRIAR